MAQQVPHVIVRFFTVPKVSDARKSAGYALVFIALLYTTAPAVQLSRVNFIESIQEKSYIDSPDWFKLENMVNPNKNEDGLINYFAGKPFEGSRPVSNTTGSQGEREIENTPINIIQMKFISIEILWFVHLK